MPSFKSQIFNFMLRNRHLLSGKLKAPVWDFNTSIPEFRAACERGTGRFAGPPEGVEITPLQIGAMYAEWLTPTGAAADKAILYTVGGGYVSGTCNDHRDIVAKLVKGCGVKTLVFNHRLAPEDPFPAALDDSLEAYRWLLDQGYRPENLMIVGESAGGGLALATLLGLREPGLPMPAAAVALSPWTDLTRAGESYKTRANVCLSPKGMAMVCSKYYVGDNDPRNPLISPLFGDLRGLPPLLIQVGDHETMRDDSIRFAEKAQAAGVDVNLTVAEGMVHCYALMAPMFPEATQAMNEICEYIKKHLG